MDSPLPILIQKKVIELFSPQEKIKNNKIKKSQQPKN